MRGSRQPCMGGQRPLVDLPYVETGEARNIERETLIASAVEAHRRLRRGPRAIKLRQIPVMKNIEKIAKRRVTSMLVTLTRNFANVDGERSIRAEHAEPEEAQLQTLPIHPDTRYLARREDQTRLLAKPERFSLRKPGRTDQVDCRIGADT